MSITFKEAMKNSGCYTEYHLNDEQYIKIEKAANTLIEKLKLEYMVKAAYALMADIDKSRNEAMALAYQCLEESWENFSLIHNSEPYNLLSTMLLYACDNLSEKDSEFASVLWLTISDVYNYLSVNRKKQILTNDILTNWSNLYESFSVSSYEHSLDIDKFTYNLYTEDKLSDENHPEISPKILVKNLNEISRNTSTSLNKMKDIVSPAYKFQNEKIEILWWYEAKFSPSIHKSYREIDIENLPLIMSIDLINTLTALPSTTSTTYFLAEALNNIKNDSFSEKYDLTDILTIIRNESTISKIKEFSNLNIDLINGNSPLNIRDLIIGALLTAIPIQELINRSIITISQITLTDLCKAIFRQEQGIRLSLGTN